MNLWGGRFAEEPDAIVAAFTHSLPFDQRMAVHDIRGSLAHCRMLAHTGILEPSEAEAIEVGLRHLLEEVPGMGVLTGAEDIHSWVETRLRERIGPVAGKLHTARSRNDQVATDLRLFLRDAVQDIENRLRTLQRTLLDLSIGHTETVLPGYTHLQHAQPIVLAHHLLAYFWMLSRDQGRLVDWRRRANILPLGAGALAGAPYPINRAFTANELGFDGVGENSLDNVSDRDFVLELAAGLAILQMHLSRLAEELVLWSSREFGFFTPGDSVSTGSSIMPQKKNPDVAELVRGKTGRVYGTLTSLLVTMKGIPLAYDSDMQEDKEAIFDSLETVAGSLTAMEVMLRRSRFEVERMRAATAGDYSTATDLADFLSVRGIPFREAHEVVGRIVRWCEENGRTLETLGPEELMGFHSEFEFAPDDVAGVDASVRGRRSQGGTAPDLVMQQLRHAEEVWAAAGQ